MSTTTARLGFVLQDPAENPGGWGAVLNSGLQSADDKIFRTGVNDPNTLSETADYVGQQFWQTAGAGSPAWWTASVAGSPGTWVESDRPRTDDVITTQGDIITGDGSGEPQRLAVGLDADYLQSDGVDPFWGPIVEAHLPQGPYLSGIIHGLQLSNSLVDTLNDLVCGVGHCRNEEDTTFHVNAAAMTKQIDAAWVAGNNQGGMLSGAVAANTWYDVWAFRNAATGVFDYGFQASGSGPMIPGAHIGKRRLGSVKTGASSEILQFRQYGDRFLWVAPIVEESVSGGLLPLGAGVSIPLDGIPPNRVVQGIHNAYIETGAGRFRYVLRPTFTNAYNGTVVGDQTGDDSGNGYLAIVTSDGASPATILRDSSLIGGGNLVNYTLYSLGWIDNRGKDYV